MYISQNEVDTTGEHASGHVYLGMEYEIAHGLGVYTGRVTHGSGSSSSLSLGTSTLYQEIILGAD